jgi:transposase-like protein
MARYGQKFKDAVVARLLPPESSPIEAVAQKIGISVPTLERWRAAALAANDGNGSPRQWTPAARLEAVIATAAMDETARSAWCREHGLFPADLDRWKQDALSGLGDPRDENAAEAKPARRRIKELERDLSRKDKALAETAALLVLSKKLAAIFRDGADA